MSMKKSLLTGLFVILGLGLLTTLVFAQTEKNSLQNRVRTEVQLETRFIDENGDGINDLARDHDGDGIPNGQGPDWTRPQDGNRFQTRSARGKLNGNGPNWDNASFRSSAGPFGNGVCQGTGPQGNAGNGNGGSSGSRGKGKGRG